MADASVAWRHCLHMTLALPLVCSVESTITLSSLEPAAARRVVCQVIPFGFLLSIFHFANLLRYSRCSRSTPLPSLGCRRPFTVRRTRQARVTPACAFPCPIRRSSRAAAPSSVPRAPALPRVCAPLGAGLRPLRAHAPVVGQVHSARVVHAAAAARRTRTRALPRRAAPPVCVLACGCDLLTMCSRCCAAELPGCITPARAR